MHSNEYEAAFGRFLEQAEYDKASDALFSLARAAFQAGWLAAGGAARAHLHRSSPGGRHRKAIKNLLCPAAEEISYFSN